MFSRSSSSGFTLVELAITLMIIGLLIAGVLKGVELVENAKVTKVARQIKAYQTAVVSFASIYSALPGDMATSATRIANCTSATYCSGHSNGDGVIYKTNQSDRNNHAWHGNGGWDEMGAFWQQLAHAGLIEGIDTNAAPDYSTGAGMATSVYPGTEIYVATWSDEKGPLLWFLPLAMWSAPPNNNGSISTPWPIPAAHVAQLDRKIDDGLAADGDIQGYVSSVGRGCTSMSDDNAYLEANPDERCHIFARIYTK